MGMHAHGEVWWGYDLADMTDDGFDSTAPAWLYDPDDGPTDRDWEDELATRLGWTEVPFPDHLDFNWDTRSHEQHPDYIAYKEARTERDRLVADMGVAMQTYGYSDGDTQWSVIIPSSRVSATYEAIRIDLTTADDWAERVARFAALLDLPAPTEPPGWHVSSSYG
jgi:hypothetical protein